MPSNSILPFVFSPLIHPLAWYEFYPDYAYNLGGVNFSPGNVVQLTATAIDSHNGTVTLTNITTGKSISKTLTSATPLCQFNAGWALEITSSTTFVFSNASATTVSGSTIGPVGATVINTDPSHVTVSTGPSAVTVKYVLK